MESAVVSGFPPILEYFQEFDKRGKSFYVHTHQISTPRFPKSYLDSGVAAMDLKQHQERECFGTRRWGVSLWQGANHPFLLGAGEDGVMSTPLLKVRRLLLFSKEGQALYFTT